MSGTADSLAKVTNIANNESASVYELRIEDRTVAGLLYAETGNRVTLLATSIPFPWDSAEKGLPASSSAASSTSFAPKAEP